MVRVYRPHLKKIAAVATAVLLLASSLAASAAAKESWQDAALSSLVSVLVSSLPPDVKITYDRFASDSKQQTFEVRGLSVDRTLKGKTGSGDLERLQVSGVNVATAVSGRPFSADRIEIENLEVDECAFLKKKPGQRCQWSADAITIEDAEIPSFAALSRAGDNPDQALQSFHFSRAVIDGTVVHTAPEAMALLRMKR